MQWTEEQKQIIDLRQKNILVSAAAGSGKTAVLVERIKSLIIKDRVPLKSMLVVTFTNAAAGEMKQRIVDSLNRELSEKDDEFLRNQIQNIYNTHISTFHSFAISILKRYYHIAEIEPSFSICPENQLEVYRNQALDKVLEEEFEKSDKEFLTFMKNYSSSKNEDAVRNMILMCFNFIQTMPEPFVWLKDSVEQLNNGKDKFEKSQAFEVFKEHVKYNLENGLRKNQALTQSLSENGVTSLSNKADQDSRMISSLIQSLEEEPFQTFLSRLGESSFQRFTASKDEKEFFNDIKKEVNKKRDSIKKYINFSKNVFSDGTLDSKIIEINETYEPAKVLYELVERFSQIFTDLKRREDYLDFNDVEHLALKVLDDDNVSIEYKNKFNYIFIDEYQDSNYIQEALIDKIKRHDNVFMVGDVKQSIYKFRRAEPSIFMSKYTSYRKDVNGTNKCIDLNKNFRSKTHVIQSINTVFMHIMEEKLSGMTYDESSFLFKGLEYDEKWDFPIEIQVIDSKKNDGEISDDAINEIAEAELEAYKISQIIKDAVGKPIFDVKLNKERPLRYRDIVILLRNIRGNSSVFYQTLMDQGIPTFADGGEDYFSTVEIETFLNLLKVIDNKRQDVPLVSAMFSPVFGFTTEELVKVRLFKRDGNYYTAFIGYIEDGPDDALREKCIQINEQLDKWKKDESFMGLDDFLWTVMTESGYYSYAGALIGGEQRRGNLRALVDRASEFTSGRIRGLYEFINYVEVVKENQIKTGQIKLLSENDDVVRVTSIHKSKGLEYPFVILGRTGQAFMKDDGRGKPRPKVRLHKDLGLGLQWENYELSAYKNTFLTDVIKETSFIESLAEEIRVLYVAMTRAMDRLVIVGSLKSGKAYSIEDIICDYNNMVIPRDLDIKSSSSFLDMLLPVAKEMSIEVSISRREELFDSINDKLDTRIEQAVDSIELSKIMSDGTNIESSYHKEVDRRLNYQYPHKPAIELKSKYSVTQLNELEKVPKKIMTYGLGDDREAALLPDFMNDDVKLTGAERGTVIHTVFEKLDFKEAIEKQGDPDYINDFLENLVNREIMTIGQRESVDMNQINRFIRSDIIGRASKSSHIRKEVPFNIIQAIGDESIIVQGIMDCFFEEDEEYVLLDYKSNFVDINDPTYKDRFKNLYSKQINLYREALETITNLHVKEAFLYLTSIGETIEIPRS